MIISSQQDRATIATGALLLLDEDASTRPDRPLGKKLKL